VFSQLILFAVSSFKVSNSFAEGLNNKIATIKKMAYGYRDIEYFKLKIYQKC